MGTFLVTPRMDPALRARVERAVSRRAAARFHAKELGISEGAFRTRAGSRGARLFPVLVALILAAFAVAAFIHDRRAIDAERRALLGAITERRAAMPAGHERLVTTTDFWITQAADPPAADLVSPKIRGAAALDAALRRPALYVHATAAELRNSGGIDSAARSSTKDAFLVCLTSPPPSPAERDMLPKVRGVYFGGAKVDAETPSIRRLADARIGLGVLAAAFEGAARTADDHGTLKRLHRDLNALPVEEVRRAAAAELLLIVADGPAEPGHATREGRVTMVDLVAGEVILRLRRRPADPGTSSMATVHRADLEACGLALAIRRGVEG